MLKSSLSRTMLAAALAASVADLALIVLIVRGAAAGVPVAAAVPLLVLAGVGLLILAQELWRTTSTAARTAIERRSKRAV
jgi:hypothetical protein